MTAEIMKKGFLRRDRDVTLGFPLDVSVMRMTAKNNHEAYSPAGFRI